MDGHEPGLAELGAPNGEDAGTQIHIVAIERQRLAEAQAGRREQTEERRVGAAPAAPRATAGAPPCERSARFPRRCRCMAGVAGTVGQEPAGRDLRARVGGAEPGGEAAYMCHRRLPMWRGGTAAPSPIGARARRDDRGALRDRGTPRSGAGSRPGGQFRAKPATQGEIGFEGLAKRAHCAPARWARASRRRAERRSRAWRRSPSCWASGGGAPGRPRRARRPDAPSRWRGCGGAGARRASRRRRRLGECTRHDGRDGGGMAEATARRPAQRKTRRDLHVDGPSAGRGRWPSLHRGAGAGVSDEALAADDDLPRPASARRRARARGLRTREGPVGRGATGSRGFAVRSPRNGRRSAAAAPHRVKRCAAARSRAATGAPWARPVRGPFRSRPERTGIEGTSAGRCP